MILRYLLQLLPECQPIMICFSETGDIEYVGINSNAPEVMLDLIIEYIRVLDFSGGNPYIMVVI